MPESAIICNQDDASEYTVEVEEIKTSEHPHRNLSMAPDPGVEISFVKKSVRSEEKVIADEEAQITKFGKDKSGKINAMEQDKYQAAEVSSIMDMIQTDTGTTDEDDENDINERGVVTKSKQSKLCIASKILLITLLIGGALAGSFFATRAIMTSVRSKSSVSNDISANPGASQTQGGQQVNETSVQQAKRANEISQLIRSISTNSTLEDPSSPQSKAFAWLAYNDQLQLSLTGNNSVSKARLTQRYIMSLFYFSLNGGGWKSITSWLSSAAECDWEQVECGKNNRVTAIDLTGKNVSGSIPEEISNLIELEKLILYDNKITSSIPSSIGKLKSLDTLDLGKNQMTGTVPNKFYMLESLRVAFLKNNKFEGSISSLVGSLSNLEMLVVSRNKFQGIAPTGLGNLTNLYVLDLSQNNFTGKFPFKAISNLTSLQYLDLSLNSLTGSLPNALFNLTALYKVILSNNKFTGDIPSAIDNLSSLQVLQLNNNTFSGSITKSLGNLLVLETLALEGNNFSGSIPNSVCSLVTSRSLTEITSDCLKTVGCECCTQCY